MHRLLALVVIIPTFCLSQSSTISDIANFEEADSAKAHVVISGKLFEMMGEMEIDSNIDASLKSLASSIAGMEAYLDFSNSTAEKILGKLNSDKSFEQYAEFSKSDGIFRFYVNESDGIVTEMIMIGHDDSFGYMASVYGRMDLSEVGRLYQLVGVNGFKYLNEKSEQ